MAGAAPIRVIVVGCGAIARWFHLPVLAGHPQIELVGLVDSAIDAARLLGAAYGIPTVAPSLRQLDGLAFDGAVVATPPSTHTQICLELSARGAHVLVEKPMALNLADAESMVTAARNAQRVLSVGLGRRLHPTVGLLRSLVRERTYGHLCSFDVEEGHVFDWPSATLSIMSRELAGGGVLVDTGSHTLDQLLWVVGGDYEVLDYADDSHGGIEANAELHLRVRRGDRSIEGRVTLSRTRTLRNTLRFDFERASIEMGTARRGSLRVSGAGFPAPPSTGTDWRYVLEPGDAPGPLDDARAPFRVQVDDWLAAIRSGTPPVLSGESVLPVVCLIERCYSSVRALAERWATFAPPAPVSSAARDRRRRPTRVLVTGAAGFIGCRVVETLAERDGVTTRALVHRPGHASRLARLGVELVQGDLRNTADLERVMSGCDMVINCAYGTEWGNPSAIRDVTVRGTERLALAARRAGVQRLVHLSTMMVYGLRSTGAISEDTPLQTDKGDVYAETKREAESIVLTFARRGLPGVILRLGNVYGPFSGPFTIRVLRQLTDHDVTLIDDGEHPSNTVYVDNAVEAILLALTHPSGEIDGSVFNVADDDGFTWREFMNAHAAAVGVTPRTLTSDELQTLETANSTGGRHRTSLLKGLSDLAHSPETRALAGRMLRTEPIGPRLRRFVDRVPSFRDSLRRRFDSAAPVYALNEAPPAPATELLRFYQWNGHIKAAKAREVLGTFTIVPRATALERSLEWARYSRLV